MHFVIPCIFITVCLVLMWHFQYRHVRHVRAERGKVFGEVGSIVDDMQIQQTGIDFPEVRGNYRQRKVHLRILDDHLAYRKVPCLWLVVTVFSDLPVSGIFDFLARPENVEYYSPASRLQHFVKIPKEWPQHAWLRSDMPEGMPCFSSMNPYIEEFRSPYMKELLVTSKGVRLVYLAGQGDRRRYQVTRSVVFDEIDVPLRVVEHLLDMAVSLSDDLIQAKRIPKSVST